METKAVREKGDGVKVNLSDAQRNLLRLVSECPLIRTRLPSKDPDMMTLVDAGWVQGRLEWLEGESVWVYVLREGARGDDHGST
jgi:hypothetical protein